MNPPNPTGTQETPRFHLPRPKDRLADCVWLPRIVAKARLLAAGQLPAAYEQRFGAANGVDGHFLAFFRLTRGDIESAARLSDSGVALWFTSLPSVTREGVERWNHVAVNLGRPGYPMAERLPVALSTTYAHLAGRNIESVFDALEADESNL